MAAYRFFLEGNDLASSALTFELADPALVGYVAKQAARHMASRELESGRLRLVRDLVVHDAENAEVARYPLTDFIAVA